jgi:protein-S-isoprenylcysteine O-methyltransferase Ste14
MGIVSVIFLVLSSVFLGVTYTRSVQPLHLAEKGVKDAFDVCRRNRSLSGVGETLVLLAYIVYALWGTNVLGTISGILWVHVSIGIALLSFGGMVMAIGIRHAGKETMTPGAAKELFTGIYDHVRHPQTTGTILVWIGTAVILNRVDLVVHAVLLSCVYMVATVLEERDLVLRFGDDYRVYQSKTGRFLPKIRHKK